ncbi:nucleotidyltransferase substrate binding protein [Geoalkalibacter ferrihydriticus]|uniref:nucleotidyltransferase substrate binding protein n=1 Tax=Geoalkalibacter ferrihydriticus TaxID=392333 RepID=UPI001F465D6E
MKDYLEEMGISGIIGSKGATLEAFQNGLIEDGEAWMEMIRARILSPHTYNPQTAEKIVGDILTSFYPAFEQLAQKLPTLAESSGNN